MNKFSRDLVQGMKEAAEFAEGKKAAARVHVVEVPLPTLKNWEQGRRSPDGPAGGERAPNAGLA